MSFFASLRRSKAARYVEVAPSGVRFEVPAGLTILEAALAAGVKLPHDCKVGTCGTCKAKLTQGRVNMLSEFAYTLTPPELASNFILVCQSTPRDSAVRIESSYDAGAATQVRAHKGTIIGTQQLTHDILWVIVELDSPLKYRAGQYANVSMADGGRTRSYSFAEAPGNQQQNRIALCIRRVPGGEFTEALFAGVLQQKTLHIDGPHGHFLFRPTTDSAMWIAGGSGLAPILGMLEDAANGGTMPPSVLLFGARTERDLYSLERIEKLRSAWQSQFTFMPVLSHEPAGSTWTGARGLVTDFVGAALANHAVSTAHAYLCGPPGMIDAAIGALNVLGIDLNRVSYDKFSDASHVLAQVG